MEAEVNFLSTCELNINYLEQIDKRVKVLEALEAMPGTEKRVITVWGSPKEKIFYAVKDTYVKEGKRQVSYSRFEHKEIKIGKAKKRIEARIRIYADNIDNERLERILKACEELEKKHVLGKTRSEADEYIRRLSSLGVSEPERRIEVRPGPGDELIYDVTDKVKGEEIGFQRFRNYDRLFL